MPVCVVTGGAGFLGSHLCEYLLELGDSVICIDNLDTGSLENIEHIGQPEFQFINQDLTEFVPIDGPVDFIYHLASPASPIDYARLPLHTLKVGSYGTHHMLGLAKVKRARFLLASTSEVYGDPEVHPQPESYWGHVNPIGPRGVYDEAKRYAEALTMAYHRQQGVDTRIARIFNTYGPRMRPARRPRDPDLPAPGAAGQAADRLRRRLADAQLLLRRRPDPRPRRADVLRVPPAGEPRQPERDVAAGARRDGDRGDGVALGDRLRGAAPGRPEGAPARHLAGARGARAGSPRSSCATACA